MALGSAQEWLCSSKYALLLAMIYCISSSILAAESPTTFAIQDHSAKSEMSLSSTNQIAESNLILSAIFPENLSVPDATIHWHISDMQGVQVQMLQGKDQSLSLAAGTYQVKLAVGRFESSKSVLLQERVVTKPYFKANIAHLAVLANHTVDWSIHNLKQTANTFEIHETQQLEEYIPAGFYEVTPTHSGVARRQVVELVAGASKHLNINIPMVQVSLIAIENNQPLFKPVEWEVFRLEKGERHHVGTYYQHSQGITVSAGYYEVVAKHNTIVRSRQFWVKENTNNKVILAMD